MTLRELLLSVDSEEYSNVPLYQTLLKVKPEYGSNTRIAVRLKDGELTISSSHFAQLDTHNLIASCFCTFFI